METRELAKEFIEKLLDEARALAELALDPATARPTYELCLARRELNYRRVDVLRTRHNLNH
jgi:hypothetical protein